MHSFLEGVLGKMRQLICLLVLSSSTLAAQLNSDGDFQLWSRFELDSKIRSSLSSRLVSEGRWGDHASLLYFAYIQAQLVYATKWLEIAPGYRGSFFLRRPRWIPIHNPMLDITLFFPGHWRIEDRSRIFYAISEEEPPFWIYRNRVRLISPKVSCFYKVSFFIDEEVFFVERRGFMENRIGIGILKEISSTLHIQANYLYRNLKIDDWTFQNILFLGLFFKY